MSELRMHLCERGRESYVNVCNSQPSILVSVPTVEMLWRNNWSIQCSLAGSFDNRFETLVTIAGKGRHAQEFLLR